MTGHRSGADTNAAHMHPWINLDRCTDSSAMQATPKQRALHIRRCAREQDEMAVRAEPAMADSAITNDVKGKVAVVLRGGASFAEKAVFVQAAGAIGMVVANSEDALGRLVGTAPDVTIPYVAARVLRHGTRGWLSAVSACSCCFRARRLILSGWLALCWCACGLRAGVCASSLPTCHILSPTPGFPSSLCGARAECLLLECKSEA